MDSAPSPVLASALSPPPAHAELQVHGMTCAGCVRRVETALAEAPGVARAHVNFATRTAAIDYDAAQTSPAALVRAVDRIGYRAEPADPDADADAAAAPAPADDPETRDLRRRLMVAAVCGLPVVVLGMSHGALAFPGSDLVQLALSLPVIFYSGAPIFRAAVAALRHGAADMNTLVALGSGAAFLYSVAALLFTPAGGPHGAGHGRAVYFEAAVAVLGFVLLGRLLESRARARAGEALRKLRSLVPPRAILLLEGREREVPLRAVRPGDAVVLRPGSAVPADGDVTEGETAVDEAMLTGESAAVPKAAGDRVYAGTLNTTGRLVYRATRTGRDTTIGQIAAAVERAQGSRAPIARLADRVSAVFTPAVLLLALATFAFWYLHAPPETRLAQALVRAVAVLVVACPCALGLATPAALVVGLGRGAELGVLFRDAAALERASRIRTVVLDKTGTLTKGRPQLAALAPAPGRDGDTLLALAAAAEAGSEHPLGRALHEEAARRGLSLPAATAFQAAPGHGVRAQVGGQELLVGSPAFLLRERGIAVGEPAPDAAGLTPVAVALDGQLVGVLGLGDTVRDEAAAALTELRALGVEPVMLTGDQAAPAARIAAPLGITRVHAGATPLQKAAHVRALRGAAPGVAMVGDGVNDAPALAEADLGVSLGHGADVAQAAADMTLLRSDLRALPAALRLSRATMRVIRQNLGWALVYNALGIPLAAGVLGGGLSPMVAGLLMSLSSVSVLLNSLRLRRAVV